MPAFLLTFFVPGTLFSLLALKNKTVDLLLFFIYVIIFGFLSQIVIAIIFHLTRWLYTFSLDRFLLISILLSVSLLFYLYVYRKAVKLPTVKIDSYAIAAILVTVIIVLSLLSHFNGLNNSYFNPATDQYAWLSQGETFLHDTYPFYKVFWTSSFYHPFFFILLSPYQNFINHNLADYQNFIKIWIILHYIFISIAISRLALSYLTPSILGILAPLILFSMHWFNYYLISTGVVPQNTALLLLIIGFLIRKEKIKGWLVWMFLFLFYIIHLPTFAMFIPIVGCSKIIEEGYKFFFNKFFIRGKFKHENWHIFDKLFFIPTLIVILIYLSYLFGLISYYDPQNSGYYEDYGKNYGLWTQPYTENYQDNVIWLALLGVIVILVMNFSGNILMVFGLLLPWAFLKTPLVASHAFYASWQAFRYYLILYPSLSILAIYPLSVVYRIIGRLFSYNSGKIFVVLIIIFLVPFMSNRVWRQQSYVFLDMIIGRDGGVYYANYKNAFIDLFNVKKLINKDASYPLVLLSTPPIFTHNFALFAFAPRKILLLTEDVCNEISCELNNNLNLFEMENILTLYNKKGPNKSIDLDAIRRKFKHYDEIGDYILLQ